MNLNKEERNFYKKLILIGIPVVCQNLISNGLNLMDTLMIGMLGEEEIAAVGAANQIFFISTVILFGLYSGAAVFTAQYYGAGDLQGVRKMLGIDCVTGLVVTAVFTCIALFIPEQIIGLFSRDPEVITYGTEYIKIAGCSYCVAGLSMAISYNSRAVQRLKAPTIINACALTMNVILNYFLIFGIGPFPQLGVKGAAIATLISRVVEFASLLIYIYTRKEHPFKAKLTELMGFSKELYIKSMKMAVPVVITDGSWAIAVAIVFAAYGMLGTAALAVTQVSNVITEMLQSVYYGVGNATAMLIGETLGQGDKEGAYRNGKRAVKVVLILNVIILLVTLAIIKPVVGIYNFDIATGELLAKTLFVIAFITTPRMIGDIYLVGILRSGGDTVFCMILELICNIVVQIPIAFIAVQVLGVSLPVAMIIGELGDIIRIAACMPRFRSKKWINIVIN